MTTDVRENTVKQMIQNPSHYMFLGTCDNPRYVDAWAEVARLPLGTSIYSTRNLTCTRRNGFEDPKFSIAQGERLIVRRIMDDYLAVERPERPDWAGQLHCLCACALHFMKCQPQYGRN